MGILDIVFKLVEKAKKVKKYDPKDLNTDWHDDWRDAMENNDSDKE